MIYAGDPKQLAPFVQSDNHDLKISLFEKLQRKFPQFTTLLQVQYRMNEIISNFISEYMYDGRIQSHESVAHHTLLGLLPVFKFASFSYQMFICLTPALSAWSLRGHTALKAIL